MRARQRAGLSQERVAHMAGIASYTYQKFEKGESKRGTPLNPRLTTLVALSQVLHIEVVDLLPADTPDLTGRRLTSMTRSPGVVRPGRARSRARRRGGAEVAPDVNAGAP